MIFQSCSRVVPDPVGAGIVDRLGRPGGNVTGFSAFEYGLSGKWLEMLKEIAPNVTRVAVLRNPAICWSRRTNPRVCYGPRSSQGCCDCRHRSSREHCCEGGYGDDSDSDDRKPGPHWNGARTIPRAPWWERDGTNHDGLGHLRQNASKF